MHNRYEIKINWAEPERKITEEWIPKLQESNDHTHKCAKRCITQRASSRPICQI
jgi:hypothetical protein